MNFLRSISFIFFVAVIGFSLVFTQNAAATDEDLAKQLQNPVAALISIPFQFNYDQDMGPSEDGERWLLNLQPVVPVSINDEWNLISRTILPVIDQEDTFPGSGSQTGVGDVVQSLFFSPVKPTRGGWIWGAGPVFLLPTGSDDLLTTDKWGGGPTLVGLKQKGPWTYGGLANHIWSFAGDTDREDVNASYFQPFVSYTTPSAWSFAVNTESTYDWQNDQWSVPVNAVISKVTKIAGQSVSLGAGLRYWMDTPENGPEGLGFRFNIVLLLPK